MLQMIYVTAAVAACGVGAALFFVLRQRIGENLRRQGEDMPSGDSNGTIGHRVQATLLGILILSTGWSALALWAVSGEKPDGVWHYIDGLGAMYVPRDNPITDAKIELGRKLFSESLLSAQSTHSCASCHDPSKGFANDDQELVRRYDPLVSRATPTLWLSGFQREYYWDGREKTLEGQIYDSWTGSNMGIVTPQLAAETTDRINEDAQYKEQFVSATGRPATPDSIVYALATYLRSLIPADSRWYNVYVNADQSGLSAAAKQGKLLFEDDEVGCAVCHIPPLFTDFKYHEIVVSAREGSTTMSDLGRAAHTRKSSDRYRFKTPIILGVADNGPYFHTGNRDFSSLRAVIEYKTRSRERLAQTGYRDPVPRILTEPEKDQLTAFVSEIANTNPVP